MKLPDVQIELFGIERQLKALARKLAYLNREISRRKGHKGPISSRPVTPAIIKEVWRLYKRGYMSQQQIAEHLGINNGRVSEIIRGKRK